MTRTEALRKLYKKVTDEEAPVTANTITEVLVALADKYSGNEPVVANTITDALLSLADNYDGGITPTGKITITENGTGIDIAEYATADVSVSGGSSDFSTAQVTVINNTSSDVMCFAAMTLVTPIPAIPPTAAAHFMVNINDTVTETVILYMGNSAMEFETSGTLSGSGDVEIDGLNAYVTGDCTITIGEGGSNQI